MIKLAYFVEKFYESRFCQSKDIFGNDLCAQSLEKLKQHIQPEEFYFYKRLDFETRKLISLLSEEEDRDGTKEDENQLNAYEKLADNTNIPHKYRRKMYDLILIGHEKYVQSNTRYIEILNKSISLTNRNSGSLERAYMLAKIHSKGAKLSALLQTYQILRRKHMNTNDFPRLEEILELERQQSLQNKQILTDISRQEVKRLIALANSSKLSPKEKIDNYHKSLDLLKKCGLRQNRNLRFKSYIYGKIKDTYKTLGDEEAVKFFAEKEIQAYLASQKTISIGLRKHKLNAHTR